MTPGAFKNPGEQVIPFLHLVRVHQKKRAGNIPNSGKVCGRPVAYIDDSDMAMGRQSRSPRHRYSP